MSNFLHGSALGSRTTRASLQTAIMSTQSTQGHPWASGRTASRTDSRTRSIAVVLRAHHVTESADKVDVAGGSVVPRGEALARLGRARRGAGLAARGDFFALLLRIARILSCSLSCSSFHDSSAPFLLVVVSSPSMIHSPRPDTATERVIGVCAGAKADAESTRQANARSFVILVVLVE